MENLFLVVGLGNPGGEYARTRHNAGFMLVDRLATRWRADWSVEKKFQARVARADQEGRRVLLCQPQTYMNASGESVGAMVSYYQLTVPRLLVAVDDADLPLGELRLRPGGSSGGHHGLESIEEHLGTRDYARLRIGIGRQSPERRITGHVLGRFSQADEARLETVLVAASDQVQTWLESGIQKAMSQFNGVVVDPENEGK